jgi:transcriptional regulator with XRE-family HTH domain
MTTLRDIRHFPGLLAELREGQGWSQSRLGDEAGLDHSFVCLLEGGKRTPSRTTIARLARTLRLTPDDTGRLFVAAGYLPPGRWVMSAGWLIQPEHEAAP